MPGPRPRPIVLTDPQRETLEHLTRRTSSTQGLVRRARIVLAAAEGHNNEQIARKLGINRETARLWRRVWSDAAELLAAAEEEETPPRRRASRPSNASIRPFRCAPARSSVRSTNTSVTLPDV